LEQGRNYKLFGDGIDGDVGHLANSVHPDNKNVFKNAKFDLQSAKSKKEFFGTRARFNIIATKNIIEGEEIIVNYGKNYWKILKIYKKNGFIIIVIMIIII
jgi:hypothetical protein